MSIQEIILFYSSFSEPSMRIFHIIKKYGLPILQICLDTDNFRSMAMNGEKIQILSVPTLLVTYTNQQVQLYVGEQKIGQYIDAILQRAGGGQQGGQPSGPSGPPQSQYTEPQFNQPQHNHPQPQPHQPQYQQSQKSNRSPQYSEPQPQYNEPQQPQRSNRSPQQYNNEPLHNEPQPRKNQNFL